MPKFIDKSFPILYADDTTLCFRNKFIEPLIFQCNSELNKFSNWCKANKLTINLDKTCFMVISNRNFHNLDSFIKIDNIPIKCIDSHKFLGVNIDNKLKFNLHISDICSKISKSIGILYKLSNYLPSSTLLNIYNSLIHSHLMYCNPIWGGTYNIHINPLFILQKKCLRIVNKTSYLEHTNPLFISNNVLKLREIHKYSQICFIHKNFNDFLPFRPTHSHSTRQNSLDPKFQRLTLCQKSIFYSGIKNWNSIPVQIRNIDESKPFKRKLKQFILDTYN